MSNQMTKRLIAMAAACFAAVHSLFAVGWTLSESNPSYIDERIEATQNGGDSNSYSLKVPLGKRATVQVCVGSVSSSCISTKSIYVKWNGDSPEYLAGEGSGASKTFDADASITVGVSCSPGTHNVQKTIWNGTQYVYYYVTEEYTAYQCAVVYDIRVAYESLLPDLTVSSLSLSKSEATSDEELTLSYAVKNVGGKAAAPSTAFLYDGDRRIRTISIEELAPGASSSASLSMSNVSVGRHVFKLAADAQNSVAESNEANNESTVALTVYERGAKYTVKFNANGGSGTMAAQTFACGETKALRLCTFTNGDKVFGGWADKPNGSAIYMDGVEISNLSLVNGGSVILYAVWNSRAMVENGVLTRVISDGMEEFSIPDTVTSIGEKAFENCTSLKRITIPSSVTNICPLAFLNCTSLGDITVPTNVLEIGYYAFKGCGSLTKMILPFVGKCRGKDYSSGAGDYAVFCYLFGQSGDYFNGSVAISQGGTTFSTYYIPESLKEVTITDDPDIGYAAFSRCPLVKVVLPERECQVGQWAFRDCNELRDMRIPAKTRVASYAFAHCQNLESVTFACEEDIGIYDYTFWDCPKLTSVSLFTNGLRCNSSGAYVDSASVVNYVSVNRNEQLDSWLNSPVVVRDTLEVTFDANGGVGEMKPQKFFVDLRQQLKPNAFARRGYAFRGWATRPDGDVVWSDTELVEFASSSGRILYAVWEPVKYIARFHKNDGSADLTAEQEIEPGVETQLRSLAKLGWAKRGLDFVGWGKYPHSSVVWKPNLAKVIDLAEMGDMVDLYAIWSVASDGYVIEFWRNDGAGTWRWVGFKHGEKTRMPTLAKGLGWARRGYLFNGWALSGADANTLNIWKGDWGYVASPVAAGSTLMVYASWSLKPGFYQIRFNKNDGTGKWRTLGFECGASAKLNTLAGLGWERDGYTFKGWGSNKANADAGKVWKLDGAWVKDATAEGKTLSIYAIWE